MGNLTHPGSPRLSWWHGISKVAHPTWKRKAHVEFLLRTRDAKIGFKRDTGNPEVNVLTNHVEFHSQYHVDPRLKHPGVALSQGVRTPGIGRHHAISQNQPGGVLVPGKISLPQIRWPHKKKSALVLSQDTGNQTPPQRKVIRTSPRWFFPTETWAKTKKKQEKNHNLPPPKKKKPTRPRSRRPNTRDSPSRVFLAGAQAPRRPTASTSAVPLARTAGPKDSAART